MFNCVEHKKALENPTHTKMAKTIRKVGKTNSKVNEKLFNTAYYIAVLCHYLSYVVSYTLKVSFNFSIISLNPLQQRRMSRFLKGRVKI